MQTPRLSLTARAAHCTAFLDDAGPVLADISRSGARADVDGYLHDALLHQGACARLEAEGNAATFNRQQLRHALRLEIVGVVRLAQARLPIVPEVRTLVAPYADASASTLLTAAQFAVGVAGRYEAPLVAYGMGAHTLRRLVECADDLRRALDADRDRAAELRQTRAALKASLARLRLALRALDGLVLSHLVASPGLAAQWSAIFAGRAVMLDSRAA